MEKINVKKNIIELCPLCQSNNLTPLDEIPKPIGRQGYIPTFDIRYSCQYCHNIITIRYNTEIINIELKNTKFKKIYE